MYFPDIYDFQGNKVFDSTENRREEASESLSFLCLGVPYTAVFHGSSAAERQAFADSLSRYDAQKNDVGIHEILLHASSLFPGGVWEQSPTAGGQVYVKSGQLFLLLEHLSSQIVRDRRIRLFAEKGSTALSLGFLLPDCAVSAPPTEDTAAQMLAVPRFLFRYILQLALAGGFDFRIEARAGALSFRLILPFRRSGAVVYNDLPCDLPPEESDKFS